MVVAQATWWTVPAPGMPRPGRRRVVRVDAAALLAAGVPAVVTEGREAERPLEQAAAPIGLGRVRAHAVEALERVLLGNLRMPRDEWLVLETG